MAAKTKVDKKPKRVISVDPGVDNLGWCIVNLDGSVEDWGLVTKTLSDLKKPQDLADYRNNMAGLIATLSTEKRQDFIMERYMPRGMRRGNQVERINIVIGTLLGTIPHKDAYMVPASSWKNHREKNYTFVDNPTIPIHIVDTYTMALYYLERIKGYLSIKDVKRRLRVVRESEYGWKKTKGVWVKVKEGA